MKKLDMVVLSLLIASGINWGLWGFFEFNLIEYVISNQWINYIIYIIFGIASVYYIIRWRYFFGKRPRK